MFITSRPGNELLAHIEPTPCIRAQLKKLSEEDVKEYIAQYSMGDQKTFSDTEHKFGMDFLERPSNLTLACCRSLDHPPHQHKELFRAVDLVRNPGDWKALLKDIKKNVGALAQGATWLMY